MLIHIDLHLTFLVDPGTTVSAQPEGAVESLSGNSMCIVMPELLPCLKARVSLTTISSKLLINILGRLWHVATILALKHGTLVHSC